MNTGTTATPQYHFDLIAIVLIAALIPLRHR
jgi:hypothetical protein